MLKRIFAISVLVLMFTGVALAQKNGVIRGVITDEQSGDKFPFATISLKKDGEAIPLGTVSGEDGAFKITGLQYGTYSVVISFIGYKTKTLNEVVLSKETPKINLGNISIAPTKVNIKEVEVKAMSNTASTKIDRKTYQASDFATSEGGTAVDLLDKIPAVSVDGEGTVSVRGTGDFLVYINGKPTQTSASDILSQLPAAQIKSVDIITVPGARYDAQGKGGIINIATQKGAADGLSIVGSGMLGGTPWTNKNDVYSNQKLDNNRYNTSISLNYNKDKLSVSGALSTQSRNNKGKGIIDPYIYQHPQNSVSGYPGSYYVLKGIGSRPKWYTNTIANAGINYQISKKSEIAANFQYSNRTSGRTANYVYQAYFSDAPNGKAINGTKQNIYNPNDIHRDGWFSNLSIDYKHKISKQSQWSSSLIYETSSIDQTIDNKEFDYDGERYYYNDKPAFHSYQSDGTPLSAYRFVWEYQHTFNNGNQINTGIQPQWVRLEGEFAYDTIIGNAYWGDAESYNNNIDLKRDIYSAYVDYRGKRGKLDYILGLRAEYMDQLMNVSSTEYFDYVYSYFSEVGEGRDFRQTDFKQRKFDLFPTLHTKYTINQLNSISLAVSRRINRPPAKNMAPFLYRRHQEIYEMGDPLLDPEYTLNAELNYERKFGNNNITLTGFYRGVNNAIYRVNRVAYDMGNPGGVLLRSYTNAGNQKAIGAELGLNLDVAKKVKLYLGGSLYNFKVIADDELLGESRNSQSTNWNVKSNASWMITAPLKLTVDYSIKSASVNPQGESLQFESLNAALNYKPQSLKGWAFTAKVLDIMGTNQAGGYLAAYEGEQILLRRGYVYDYEGQIVEIGISYSFNNKKQKAQRKHIGEEYF